MFGYDTLALANTSWNVMPDSIPIRARLSRSYPFAFARDRIFRRWLGCSETMIHDGELLTLPDGRVLRMRAARSYSGVYLFQEHEPVETRVMTALVRPGDRVADIGANFGWFTTHLGRLVGPEGHVHAFEPLPAVHDELRFNVHANSLEASCSVNQLAIGEQQGTITLSWHARTGDTHASRTRGGDCAAQVRQTTLDAYATEHGVSFSFVKCDVEGMEQHVLTGAREVLASARPILLFEHQDPSKGDGDDAHLIAYLRDLGYTDFWSCLRTQRSLRRKLRYYRLPQRLEELVRIGLLEPNDGCGGRDPLVRNVLAFDRRRHGDRTSGLVRDPLSHAGHPDDREAP